MATSSRRKKSEKAVQPRKEDAFLQRYNVELLKCIDDMKLKRDEVHRDILTLSEEQHKLEYDVTHLTGQLARVNESLCKKMKQQTECDELLREYEEAFNKLLYGQQTLLANVRRAVNTVAPSVILEESEAASLSSRQAPRSSRMSVSTRAETRADGRRDSRRESRTDYSHQESRAESMIQWTDRTKIHLFIYLSIFNKIHGYMNQQVYVWFFSSFRINRCVCVFLCVCASMHVQIPWERVCTSIMHAPDKSIPVSLYKTSPHSLVYKFTYVMLLYCVIKGIYFHYQFL